MGYHNFSRFEFSYAGMMKITKGLTLRVHYKPMKAAVKCVCAVHV